MPKTTMVTTTNSKEIILLIKLHCALLLIIISKLVMEVVRGQLGGQEVPSQALEEVAVHGVVMDFLLWVNSFCGSCHFQVRTFWNE